jgi:hypothetical protein
LSSCFFMKREIPLTEHRAHVWNEGKRLPMARVTFLSLPPTWCLLAMAGQ